MARERIVPEDIDTPLSLLRGFYFKPPILLEVRGTAVARHS